MTSTDAQMRVTVNLQRCNDCGNLVAVKDGYWVEHPARATWDGEDIKSITTEACYASGMPALAMPR